MTFRSPSTTALPTKWRLLCPLAGDKVPDPQIVVLNIALAAELGLDPTVLNSAATPPPCPARWHPAGASPLAMAYAGHQFGVSRHQLGDGPAILLGELIDTEGRRHRSAP